MPGGEGVWIYLISVEVAGIVPYRSTAVRDPSRAETRPSIFYKINFILKFNLGGDEGN